MFDMDLAQAIQRMTIAFVPLMLGIILHEVAHAWMANRCGDPTARMLGRITLNPIPHIDPMGLAVFALTSLLGPFTFGWAKPVPINPNNFKSISKDTIWVSAAGPLSNFILAFFFAVGLRLLLSIVPHADLQNNPVTQYLFYMLQAGITINLTLAWLNLMPIPPLDGSKIVWGLLPGPLANQYMQLGRFGFILIILLLMTGMLGTVLFPLIRGSIDIMLALVGL